MDLNTITLLMLNLEEEKLFNYIDHQIALNPSEKKSIRILKACQEGCSKAAILFEEGHYFLGDLLFAGYLFKEIKRRLQPHIDSDISQEKLGDIYLDIVYGIDAENGAYIVKDLLESVNFNVIMEQRTPI